MSCIYKTLHKMQCHAVFLFIIMRWSCIYCLCVHGSTLTSHQGISLDVPYQLTSHAMNGWLQVKIKRYKLNSECLDCQHQVSVSDTRKWVSLRYEDASSIWSAIAVSIFGTVVSYLLVWLLTRREDQTLRSASAHANRYFIPIPIFQSLVLALCRIFIETA